MQANKLDHAALGVLLASAVVVGWPIWMGGSVTYMDNPVHLAELHAFASGEQWTDIGFCGFPLGYLHSPIWYGGLSFLITLGVPAGSLFAASLFLASLFPSVAIYLIARRGLPPLAALVPAWLLLVQRTAIVGFGSVFAGMATFYIATGLLIIFVDLLARTDRSWRQVRYITFCLALLALTHIYALLAAVLVAVIHSARLLVVRPMGWRIVLGRDSVAYVLAALCSSLYWHPLIREISTVTIEAQNLHPRQLMMRLLAPTDIIGGIQTDLYLIDALPLIALVALGVIGMRRTSRWPNATSLYGALLALGLGVILFGVLPATHSALFGPNSWRFLFILRIGLALAALPVFLGLSPYGFAQRRRTFAAVGGVMLIASVGLGSPLRSQVGEPEGPAWDNLQELWTWLRSHDDTSGRVFVQSTLMTEPRDHPFVRSHVLALTSHESGVRQVGAYYGIVPYKTRIVTGAEFGQVLGLSTRRKLDHVELDRRLELTNTTRLVMVDPDATETLVEAKVADVIMRVGRYTVLRVNAASTGWISGDDARVQVKEWSPGHVVFDLTSATFPTTVVVKQSYHPGWTVSPGATLSESPDGLLELSLEHQPQSNITLTWKPYRAQVWMTASGWIVLLLWFLIGVQAPSDSSQRAVPKRAA